MPNLSVKMSAEEANEIIDKAIAAADAVAAATPEDRTVGFAWVSIEPARGPIVTALKKRGMGDKAVGGGRFQVWSTLATKVPKVQATKSLALKKSVCRAFAAVMKKHGITAYCDARGESRSWQHAKKA